MWVSEAIIKEMNSLIHSYRLEFVPRTLLPSRDSIFLPQLQSGENKRRGWKRLRVYFSAFIARGVVNSWTWELSVYSLTELHDKL